MDLSCIILTAKAGRIRLRHRIQGKCASTGDKVWKAYTRHNALDNVLKEEKYAIPQAFVFCNKNISTQEKIAYLPIYMIGFLEKRK